MGVNPLLDMIWKEGGPLPKRANFLFLWVQGLPIPGFPPLRNVKRVLNSARRAFVLQSNSTRGIVEQGLCRTLCDLFPPLNRGRKYFSICDPSRYKPYRSVVHVEAAPPSRGERRLRISPSTAPERCFLAETLQSGERNRSL